jgi:hypothetical protein
MTFRWKRISKTMLFYLTNGFQKYLLSFSVLFLLMAESIFGIMAAPHP